MPKITPQSELDQLLDLISTYPGGVRIETLLVAQNGNLQRRSLQRRLALLVEQGRLRMLGQARSVRYIQARKFYDSDNRPLNAMEFAQDRAQYCANLSREGDEIREYVRQPRQIRKPVAYTIEFLEQYYPNYTPYLPQKLLDQLHNMGRSSRETAPAGTFARDILNRLLIDLSWASSKLEGNTYSQLDTERLIEFGQAAEGKDALEAQMILNHKDAIEYLVRDPDRAMLNADTIFALHSFLSDGLMADPLACGRLRKCRVGIGGSVYLPLSFPQQLEQIFYIVVDMASEIRDPFEQAFFLMVHLPYLQPFEDVNKRVSRLAANIPFIRHNLCPLSFIDVAQQDYVEAMLGIYELNRIELLRDVFVSAYERSCQQYVIVQRDLVPPDPFRVRYRRELTIVIADIVQSDEPETESAIRSKIPATVAVSDIDHFVELVSNEFKSTHPGNSIRFGIRPLEFSGWRERHQA